MAHTRTEPCLTVRAKVQDQVTLTLTLHPHPSSHPHTHTVGLRRLLERARSPHAAEPR